MELYIIKREDRRGEMLQGLAIRRSATKYIGETECTQTEWTMQKEFAYRIHSYEEAKAIIEFITNVIDEELGEQLYIEKIS